VFPDYDWLPWLFAGGVPDDYWQDKEHQRKCVEWIAGKLNVHELDQWYSISAQQIADLGGKSILRHYNGSMVAMLLQIYPNFLWKPWRFASGVPIGFWDDFEQHSKYLEWLGTHINITHMEQWYQVTAKQISDNGGYTLMSKYNNSVLQLVSTVFPDHVWLPWKFASNVPDRFWDMTGNLRWYFDWLIQEKKLSGPQDIVGKPGTSSRVSLYYLSFISHLFVSGVFCCKQRILLNEKKFSTNSRLFGISRQALTSDTCPSEQHFANYIDQCRSTMDSWKIQFRVSWIPCA
jgi:hypothetical protein